MLQALVPTPRMSAKPMMAETRQMKVFCAFCSAATWLAYIRLIIKARFSDLCSHVTFSATKLARSCTR